MAAVERFDSNPSVMIVSTVSTGANLADKCKIALLRGVLVKDAAKVALAVGALSPVFAYVTSGDGFYIDGSFIQHTRHPYTGSYGLVLLNDVANLFYLLAGSPWDVKDAGRANVPHWVTDSFEPLLYEGAMMEMVRGRAISICTGIASPVEIFRCPASGACSATPIALTADSTVYVSLYGTGIRGPGGAPQAKCTVHGVTVPVLYAGAQTEYQGLDQVDISLPAALVGSGESDVVLTVNGQAANTVTLSIQ